MDFYEIPTWQDYQHYKDRDPPWIKLHFSLLSSSTWVMLDDASRVLAVACMLIASRNHGKVPNNPDYIRRVAYLNDVNFKPLIDNGFLVTCKQMLADAIESKQSQAKATTEKRREEKKEVVRDPRFAEFWSIYPTKKAKAAAIKAWSKAHINGEYDSVISALKVQAAACKDIQFFPHASTWINGRRWEDEVASEQSSSSLRYAGESMI